MKMPMVKKITFTKDTMAADLSDGRAIPVSIAWFPRLLHATKAERESWRLIGNGHGMHWNNIDEDISVEGLLAGRPSGESLKSFKKMV
jgi:hypothetical protein